MWLINKVFQKIGEKDRKLYAQYPACFCNISEPYDKKNHAARYHFTQCPNAEFAKKHNLMHVLPLFCNSDYWGISQIHGTLIRHGTCGNSDKCDYCVVGSEKRGIADKETVMKRSKWFMIPFCIIIFVVLILIISVWNQVTDFKTAYLQACLFLVVMNWFDGIVIDRLWVGHSKIWHINGMEGIPYVKPWKTVLIKRGAATVLYLVVALVVAGIVELLGKIW